MISTARRPLLATLVLALAAMLVLAGCPEKRRTRRTHPVRQGPTKRTPKKPPKTAQPTVHHEHSHGHPHDDYDHHHHPHPHPHLPGTDGHHHPH